MKKKTATQKKITQKNYLTEEKKINQNVLSESKAKRLISQYDT